MNTTVPLIGIFVVSKQKLNWPQSYLCFSCAHPKQDKHRPHIFYMSVWACSRRVFNSFNKYHAFCLVCRLMQIRKYDSNLKSRSSCIYVCERLKKMRTKLSRGESSDASSTAAAGWQGLLTAHRRWGTGISCYSPRYRETKKKSIKAKLRGEENPFFQNAVSKEVYPEGHTPQEWQTKSPCECAISVCQIFLVSLIGDEFE